MTASTATQTTASTPTGSPDCASLPNARTYEGKCVSNGATLTFVNKGTVAHLKSLDVKVNGVSTAQSYSSGNGVASATARGTFVTVNLTVANRLDSPQQFDESDTGQVELQVGKSTYTPNFDAVNQADQQSFLSGNNNTIQPGESQSGDVVFDVPSGQFQTALNHGAVVVVDFGASPNSATSGAVLKIF